MILQTIHFPIALPGLKDIHQYNLKQVSLNEHQIFYELSSEEGIGLILIDPFQIKEFYEVELSEEIIKNLSIEESLDTLVLCVVTVQEPFENSTVNLRAPLIFNLKQSTGYQWIRNDLNHAVRHPLKTYVEKVKQHADIE